MRVFALGGYRKVGIAALELLARSDTVSEIAVAARSGAHDCDASTVGKGAIALSSQAKDAGTCAVVATGVAQCLSNLTA